MVISRARYLYWLVVALAALAVVVVLRPREELPTHRRRLEHPIVIIGLDGADWQVAKPLMARGRLPNLKRLCDGGLSGPLRSSSPMLSPLLWTTAVTGVRPQRHGIIDFLVPDPATGRKVPISSQYRRVRALWTSSVDAS